MVGLEIRPMELLRNTFGKRLQEGASLARYTAARLGGPAEALLEVRSSQEMIEVVSLCWNNDLPFVILGGGSNVLVSDAGVRGLVVINKARQARFDELSEPPTVWAEAGANLGLLARQAAQRELSGLEWAAGIPGTLGGAVVGNAGAHGGDIAHNLCVAEILHRTGLGQDSKARREEWPVERLEYSYRSSIIRRYPGENVVLSALLTLARGMGDAVQAKVDEYVAYRKRTQPPGASLGSMFKNPGDDYAGRLIEAAGLKGTRIGDAQISTVHANFFINLGNATASDFYGLLQLAQSSVLEKMDVRLEPEIELVGEW